ncbi:hypothetical protein G9A89_017415 [Geosiphon pyriformis]|nr:hypothetical protein G9A89_017415 [Geosiphon pyriformis]
MAEKVRVFKVAAEYFEKEIKVVTDQEILKNLKMEAGYPIRKWKVALFAVNDIGEKSPMRFVEKVEYHLHPTFEKPIRVVKKPPFTLTEQGWGEFDMRIVLHFIDKTIPTKTLEHDLNFTKNHYEVPHILTFTDPKLPFKRLLTPDVNTDFPKSQNSRAKRPKSSVGGPKKRNKLEVARPEDNLSHEENIIPKVQDTFTYSPSDDSDSTPDESLSHSTPLQSSVSSPRSWPEAPPPRHTPPKPSTTKSTSPESSRSLSSSNNNNNSNSSNNNNSNNNNNHNHNNNNKENDYKVNYQNLANNLYELQGDDILEAINIVNNHRTPNMYINEDNEGEFHLDLYTLGDDLAKILWEFTVTKLENYPSPNSQYSPESSI